jgi:repressor LexA
MTKRQHQYYSVIRDFIAKNKYSPSFEEIARMVGVTSTSTVHRHVHRLAERGYLVLDPLQARGIISIVPEKMQSLSSCDRGHERIWFATSLCPLCTVLQRPQ